MSCRSWALSSPLWGSGPDEWGLICYNIISVLPFGVLASWHVRSLLLCQWWNLHPPAVETWSLNHWTTREVPHWTHWYFRAGFGENVVALATCPATLGWLGALRTPKPQVSNYLCLSGIQVAHVWAQVTFIGADPAHLGCLQSTLKTFTQNLFSEKIFSQSTMGQGSQPWCHIVLGPMPPDTISLMNVTLRKRNIQLSGQKDISR